MSLTSEELNNLHKALLELSHIRGYVEELSMRMRWGEFMDQEERTGGDGK
jgi:hypothetical protein